MSWQAIAWTEIQSRVPRIPDGRIAMEGLRLQATEALSLSAEFLRPFAAVEAALGFWRLGADAGWTGEFFVNSGMFSHWQVWIATSLFTQAASVYVHRLLPKKPESAENRP